MWSECREGKGDEWVMLSRDINITFGRSKSVDFPTCVSVYSFQTDFGFNGGEQMLLAPGIVD